MGQSFIPVRRSTDVMVGVEEQKRRMPGVLLSKLDMSLF